MNLYAMLSDASGADDVWAALVVAPTRSRARYMFWRYFSDGAALIETRYVCRLVDRGVEDMEGPRVIDSDTPETHSFWEQAKKRTGIWLREDG